MNETSSPLASALALLPHGKEFRFLDDIVALVPGRSGLGRYTLRGDERFLKGHFPADPILPGVLLLEAGAQLAGIIAQTDPDVAPLPGLRLTAVRSAKILGTIRPGETMLINASITGRFAALVQAHVEASVGDRTLMISDVALSGVQTETNPGGA